MPDAAVVEKKVGHTPGPWRSARCDEPAMEEWSLDGDRSFTSRPVASGNELVCYVAGPLDLSDQPSECDANALLIAAAPEMLEALKAWVDEVDGTFPFESLELTKAAIAKAEGRS